MGYLDNTGLARFWAAIKSYISGVVPTKTSDLTNDSGFITDAGVTSVNGSTGAVTAVAADDSVAYADIDSITKSGIYRTTGTPGLLIHLQWDTNYAVQILFRYAAIDAARMQYREKYGGTWSSWRFSAATEWNPASTATVADLQAQAVANPGVFFSWRKYGAATYTPTQAANTSWTFTMYCITAETGYVHLEAQNTFTGEMYRAGSPSGYAPSTWQVFTGDGAAGTPVAANDDLDDYTVPGLYICTSATTAATLSNSPTTAAFRMEVKAVAGNANRLVQIIYANQNETKVYMRTNTGTWGAWKSVQNDYDLYVVSSAPTSSSADGLYFVI